MAKKQRPLDKIVTISARLRMYVEHGEVALQGQTHAEFLADAHEAMNYLMEFRNMVNAMVVFDEAPQDAVLPYLDQ